MTNDFELSEEEICSFNIISEFLAVRDIQKLSSEELINKYSIESADLLILLGNSIPSTAEIAAQAFKNKAAKEIMIVGGIGHATDYLRTNIKKYYSSYNIEVSDRPEADILKELMIKYGRISDKDILIENTSTNCGSNAREALKVVKKNNRNPKSIILIQDPMMQLRSYASFKKEWEGEKETIFINYSPFSPSLKLDEAVFSYVDNNIKGLWDFERFVSLVMGEIPRLIDNEEGYGPKGKGFIVHVDVPEEVIKAYNFLLPRWSEFLKIRNKI